jgi:hypothetical protein
MHVYHVPLNDYQFFYSTIKVNSEHVEQHVFLMESLLFCKSQRTPIANHECVVF